MRGADNGVPSLFRLDALMCGPARHVNVVITDTLARDLQVAVHERRFKNQDSLGANRQVLNIGQTRLRTKFFIRGEEQVNRPGRFLMQGFQGPQRPKRLHEAGLHIIGAGAIGALILHRPKTVPCAGRVDRIHMGQQ